ncbi:polyamine ABC transporter substrate-binding protein [Acidovorax sp. D2M1]|uniref:Polyamine ABC transporter substrate-binding protein n=1 Tax=Acidovorax benzenivorans TaxID=2987520 RepID=A0ABT5RZV1_9BURK|nr:polyamine ABC transporter substrate-binding protein [Acidovorax benzenivorans]MDD2179239.1 polyamine ABC transporter substrate-binding protein [Acidovorax benzenivorans]
MIKHVGILGIFLIAASSGANAAETMYIASWGGDVEKVFREKIIPPFEAKNNIKINYIAGNSSDTLAKLMAQKSKQEISVAFMDEFAMVSAVGAGVCAKVDEGEYSKNVYQNARTTGDKSIGLGFYAAGLVYNTEIFKKNGWDAPTSWKDLEDKKYLGKIVIPSIASYGQWVLVMEARANGGSEKSIQPGFEAMKRISPNVIAWESGPAKIAQMLQTGEAALAVWGNQRAAPLIDQGVPLKFVYPKEGAVSAVAAVCPVQGGPQPKVAQAFIQYLLSPEVQTFLATTNGWGPANKDVKLPPAVAARVIYGQEQHNKLIAVDYNVIIPNMPAWTSRWNREVER